MTFLNIQVGKIVITNTKMGVMVHPLAPKWYVDIVEDICASKKIKFEGQSEIYKLK